MSKPITVHLDYYALLKEKIGVSEETLETLATTARELYQEISDLHHLVLPEDFLKVSINNVFSAWQAKLKTGDHIAFIPPVSGG